MRLRLTRRPDLIAGQSVAPGLGFARFEIGENCSYSIKRSPVYSDCVGVRCRASLPNCYVVGVWVSVGFRCKGRMMNDPSASASQLGSFMLLGVLWTCLGAWVIVS